MPSQAHAVLDWLDLSRPHLTSFLGVRFGESIERVEREYPGGAVETSPYGADLYRVENVEADSVRYESVDYEFTENLGMQLAIATFSPRSGGSPGLSGKLKGWRFASRSTSLTKLRSPVAPRSAAPPAEGNGCSTTSRPG